MNDKVKVKLLFFAKARELTGKEEDFVEISRTIKGVDLLDSLVSQFQLDCIRQNVIIALNENWVDLNSLLELNNGDEVAIVPPLSGVRSPEYGAISLFVGTTRNNFNGKTVAKLEYEAYDKMAIKSLEEICGKIRQKYDIGNIAIIHRLGDVPVGEASVVIAVSATRRKSVFEALSFAIDSLKADVPIWKKEVYEGDSPPLWKENSEFNDSTMCITNTTDCIQLREEVVEAENTDQVSSDLIQINTNIQEINRRLKSCMDSRRQQANLSNVEDFCLKIPDEDKDSTCARTNAFLFRRKDSKSHLKVHKVENATGPQMMSEYDARTQVPEPTTDSGGGKCPPGAEERLTNAESFLNIKNESANVFSRLKAIEDKILYLETVSPEYFDFARQVKPTQTHSYNAIAKKTYSSEEIDMKLCNLKSKFLKI